MSARVRTLDDFLPVLGEAPPPDQGKVERARLLIRAALDHRPDGIHVDGLATEILGGGFTPSEVDLALGLLAADGDATLLPALGLLISNAELSREEVESDLVNLGNLLRAGVL